MSRTYKKMLGILLGMSMILAGCGSTASSAELPEKNMKAKTIENLQVGIDTIEEMEGETPGIRTKLFRPFLMGEDAENYPALQASLEQYYLDKTKQVEESRLEMEELVIELAMANHQELTDERTGTVLRADSRVLSIEIPYYYNYGGVHGMYGHAAINYDAQTGKELKLTDVVTDIDAFFGLLDEKLMVDYADIYEYMTLSWEEMKEDLDGYITWSVSPEGVTVYFAPYILGSYAMGEQIVTVYFDEAPELFVEKYTETADSYAIPYDENRTYYFDVDADGEREEVEIETTYLETEYEDYYEHYYYIKVEGERVVGGGGNCSSAQHWIVYANGQYYLYSSENMENDYHRLIVFDLKTNGFDVEKNTYCNLEPYMGGDYQYTENGWVSNEMRYTFTDPSDFVMADYLHILGTQYALKHYAVDAAGYPKAMQDFYEIHSGNVVKIKQDITCELVDQNAEPEGKTKVLKAGAYIYFVRTDYETYMDVQLIDKSLVKDYGDGEIPFYGASEENTAYDVEKEAYRISCDKGEYSFVIDGQNEYDILEGISYAG